MSQPRILIVHPDPPSLALLSSMLKSLGHVIDEAANDRVAVRLMERGGIDMILAGVDPADADALELLAYIRRKHRHVPVILLFPSPHPDRTKEALRLGALAVLRYPVPATELRAAVTQALGTIPPRPVESPPAPAFAAANGNHHTPASHNPGPSYPPPPLPPVPSKIDQLARELGIVGNDPSLKQAIEMAGTIASARMPVLIQGERGTGKALLARAIHNLASRPEQPFVTVDCASLTEAMADRDRERNGLPPLNGNGIAHPPRHDPSFDWNSKLAQAHTGTLFLNDVTALSDSLQLQLLRALQDREYEHGQQNDVRFLMSTSENLVSLVEQAKFRQDLYHRVSVVCLKLPPLRTRGTDIEQLAEYFRARFSLEFGKNVVGFTRDALDILNKHDWPGNIRELEGVIQRGVALCQGTRITSGHLSPSLCHPRAARMGGIAPRNAAPANIRPLKEALEEPEKRIIIQALQALNWNRQETARVLDINRTTLYKKMKKYGLLVDEPIWVN
ncbi:MAG: sigma-54 dependent transcriptional regulator [Isosphaeraceae bacterium]